MTDQELDALYPGHVDALIDAYSRVLVVEGLDAVAIHSGSPILRSEFDDQAWPLRPFPHWQHWLPLVEADAVLIIRAGARPTLFRRPRSASGYWESPAEPESNAFARVFREEGYVAPETVRAALPEKRVAWLGEPRALAAFGASQPNNPPPVVKALDELRTKKSAYEIACMAEANRRARAGHDALRKLFADGAGSELDLHLAYLGATRQDDGETPYKNIVAIGRNAATLHHVAYGRTASSREAESLLVDAGATCRGYASDVTRTWVRGAGGVATLFSALVAGVEELQQSLASAARIGSPYEALHDASHRMVADLLLQIGLARAPADELVASGITRAFFPHGLGHSLGVQTHDVGCGLRRPRDDNPFLRNTSNIAEGQVFTIEPGIYFIPALLEALRAQPAGALVQWCEVEALAPLGGVRIEDDVAVGPGGHLRNLTREHLPQGGGWA